MALVPEMEVAMPMALALAPAVLGFTAPATLLSSVSSRVIWSPGRNLARVDWAVGSTSKSWPRRRRLVGSVGLGVQDS